MAIDNAQQLGQVLIGAAVAAGDTWRDGEPLIAVCLLVPMPVAAVIRDDRPARALGTLLPERFCRICGCTEDAACDGGCSWVEPDLCSACVPRVALLLKRTEVTHGSLEYR